MNYRFIIIGLFIMASIIAFGQTESQEAKAGITGRLSAPILVPSIAEQIRTGTFKATDPNEPGRMGQPKRHGANMTVPGKGLPVGKDPLVREHGSFPRIPGRSPELVFNANVSNYTPSDPTGAAGPNHFVGAWNIGFRIFDKSGNPLTPAASLGTLFPGNTLGDPIVLYDVAADRFIITEFDSSPNGFNVAISQGPDPVNDGWYVYTTGFTTGSFPDYPKFSIWSDGYYVTANINATNRLFVIEREIALTGGPAQFIGFPLPGIRTSGFYSPQVFNVTNGDLPPAGNAKVVYLQDDAWSGVNVDHLKIWTVNVDWDTPSNSTISAAEEVITSPFISVFDGGSFSNRPQPSGPDQDVLQATIMNQAQYRRFPTHNSVVFNFVVDTDPTAGELAGIRWFEMRQSADGEPWEIYQEGTYTSPYNNKDAFSGSMAMDALGNIGMAYTTVSSTERIAIYYTGRFASDPLGIMTIDETLIAQGTSNNPSNRLADYVHLTVDPVDDKTFWHIAEYFVSNSRTDVVGVFKIAPNFINDIGVISIDSPINGALTDSEEVTITIFNGGIDEQIDIPVSFQVNDGDEITEIIPGPIASATSMQYTFSATADLSLEGQDYELKVIARLELDESPVNDTLVTTVKHLFHNDLGLNSILRPVSGHVSLEEEEIEIIISNFGTSDQHEFEVSYNLEGQVVTEIYQDTLKSGESASYTFATTGNFGVLGSFNLSSYTSLHNDSIPANDTISVVIVKNICEPQSSCIIGLALRLVEIGSISNETSCSSGGYGNYTDLSTTLERNMIHELKLGTGYGDMYTSVWIDFNDNFIFEEDELMVDNVVIGFNQGSGNHFVTVPLTLPENAPLGTHIMRVKTRWSQPLPANPCDSFPYGETEDYHVDVTLFTGIETALQDKTDINVIPRGNQQYDITLKTNDLTETLLFNLFSVTGQKLVENRINQVDGLYSYPLDMSYAAPGVYLVRIGNARFGKIKRIVIN
ncbi:MAG: T9SS type A sorting domain-containing protein [Bacteroidetes bacterium]|nr:T9SS type A sorting domain-containing protein [Bacteroidota bacterium]